MRDAIFRETKTMYYNLPQFNPYKSLRNILFINSANEINRLLDSDTISNMVTKTMKNRHYVY